MKYKELRKETKMKIQKTTIGKIFMALLVFTLILLNGTTVRANLLKIDQGKLNTGQSYTGHAARYSAYTTFQTARGNTKAELFSLGGATVWVQILTQPHTRKSNTGIRLHVSEVSIYILGHGLYEHGYDGINPAY